MTPIDLPEEEWLGPKVDESGAVVATISHHMNVQHVQTCGCRRSSSVSEIYHTNVEMPEEYAAATWQTLLGWVGFVWHLPVTVAQY